MSRILFFVSCFLVLGIVSCSSDNASNTQNHAPLSKTDSLQILSSILAAMKEEMYTTEHLNVNSDTTELMIPCCDCPSKLDIRIDSLQEIRINNRPIPSRNAIVDSVIQYFKRGEHLKQYGDAHYRNDSLWQMEENIKRINGRIKEFKEQRVNQRIIDFHENMIDEWEQRIEICKTLKTESLYTLHSNSGVYLNYYPNRLTFNVLGTVLHAFYELRESAAQRYFGESYLRLFLSAKTNKKDVDKLRAIHYLIPVKIVDQPHLKHYRKLVHNGNSYPYGGSLVPPIE